MLDEKIPGSKLGFVRGLDVVGEENTFWGMERNISCFNKFIKNRNSS